jgi:hypothetical protein
MYTTNDWLFYVCVFLFVAAVPVVIAAYCIVAMWWRGGGEPCVAKSAEERPLLPPKKAGPGAAVRLMLQPTTMPRVPVR